MSEADFTFADTPVGIIEGFYGRPWTQKDRLEALPRFAEMGLSFYCYAPKADARLRHAWHTPMESHHERRLRALADTCEDNRLIMGVGLSPYEIWNDWNSSSRARLKEKLVQISNCGAKWLYLLLDDMHGSIDNLAQTQVEIADFVAQTGLADRLIFCPSYYSDDPLLDSLFGQRSDDYLETLGSRLDRNIDIIWTGPKVVSDYVSDAHLDYINSTLQRPVFYWDNVFANDGKLASNYLNMNPDRHKQRPSLNRLSALMINPMNQIFLSRLVLSGFLDLYKEPHSCNFKEFLQQQLPPPLADIILAHNDSFSVAGLSNTGDQRVAMLIKKIAPFSKQSPEASEILSWLNGDFKFDPACLTG